LEILFGLGYKPEFHRRIKNEVAKEITKIRRAPAGEMKEK
jgi:hypothetical protein